MTTNPIDSPLPAFGPMSKEAVWRAYADQLVKRTADAIISDAEFARTQFGDDEFVYQFGDPASIVLKWLWSGGQHQAAADVAVGVWRRVRAAQRARRWVLWSALDCVDMVRMGLDGLGWTDADHRRFGQLFAAAGRGRHGVATG